MRSFPDPATVRPAAVIAALVVVALALGYLARRPEPVRQRPDAEPIDVAARAPSVDAESPAAATDEVLIEAAASDVRAVSASFRNSTFLIAIRRAGYYCDDVTMAYESADGVWVASCMDKGGYLLTVRAADQFDIRPVLHYFDGLGPSVIPQQDFSPPSQRLDPQFAPPMPDTLRRTPR